MQHTRRTSDEGWHTLFVTLIVVIGLGLGTLFFDMGIAFRTIWTVILLVVLGIAIAYSVENIRCNGIFSCELNDHEFIQSIPVSSCGESYHLKLSEITQIEIHDGGGDGPSDEWYIHTKDSRHRITANYNNPYRKFGEAIQKSLPNIKTKNT